MWYFKRVIKKLILKDGTDKEKFTLAEAKLLVKDENGKYAAVTFLYTRVVRMLLYLSDHTHTDVAFSLDLWA